MSRGNLLLAVFTVMFLTMTFGGESDGSADYSIHSMTVYLDSSGSSDYDYMIWDFGDGTGADTRMGDPVDPVHTYSEKGTYIIRQTVFRESGRTLSDVSEHTVQILGPPTVTFMCQGSVFDTVQLEDRTSRAYGTVDEPHETPECAGKEFAGWVTQDGEPYDWNLPVDHPMVLEASWTDSPEPAPVPKRDGGGMSVVPLAGILAAIVGTAVLAEYIRRS